MAARVWFRSSVSVWRDLRHKRAVLITPSCDGLTERRYSQPRGGPDREYDVVVVGGGIVGAATARELVRRHPTLKFAIVDKEDRLAAHQSGHNSGVVHAGIYYVPGSLKARLCVRGLGLAYKYFDDHNIPYRKCGKLIVAVTPEEIPRLDVLQERGLKNGVRDLERIDAEGIRRVEPNCTGIEALWSPHTGIVDWGLVTHSYVKDFAHLGGDVVLNFPVKKLSIAEESQRSSVDGGLTHPVKVSADGEAIRCRYLVTCAGLHSDKLAAMSGCDPEPRIVPFRGEYLLLKPERSDLVRGNIYPVPDPRFPFLGVHYTPRMDGQVILGPNAVLAFKREGYGYTDVNFSELFEALRYKGLRKLARKHLVYGIKEFYKGIYIRAQVKQLQRYVPQLRFQDVVRGPTGVRAQALDRDGNLVDDFVFDSGSGELGRRTLHVRNAPSPAATSSLAIAEMIADKVEATFQL